ncbi:MAG: TIR domain-containing protein [Planctomycetota bacterium]
MAKTPGKGPFDVFVSYATADKDWVKSFVSKLRTRADADHFPDEKLRIWVDYEAIKSGRPPHATISAAVSESAVFLPILSPAYVESVQDERGCHQEWEIAEAMQRNDGPQKGRFINPILIDEGFRLSGQFHPYQRVNFAGMNPRGRGENARRFNGQLDRWLENVAETIADIRRGPLRTFAINCYGKGGVGKTTLTIGLAERIASSVKAGARTLRKGRKVLVIDADYTQAGASSLLIGPDRLQELNEKHRSLYDLLHTVLIDGESDPDAVGRYVVNETVGSLKDAHGNLMLIPGTFRPLDIESEPYRYEFDGDDPQAAVRDRRKTLRTMIREYAKANDVSVILVDTSPNPSWVTRAFLDIADGFVIPVTPDHVAIQSARQFVKEMKNTRFGLKQDKKVVAVVVNRYRPMWHHKEKAHHDAAKELASSLGAKFQVIADDSDILQIGTEVGTVWSSFLARFRPNKERADASKALQELADALLQAKIGAAS